MCTVTYIPSVQDHPFALTSNRDEIAYRPTKPPAAYPHRSQKIIYPKDEQAGGSWIAFSETGKVACLLNGAFVPHKKQKFHTLSRGIILVEFTASENTCQRYFSVKDLSHVEPFTIVSFEHSKGQTLNFIEFIWDGQDKHFRPLESNSAYIWSSVTLYTEEQRAMRKNWFEKFYNDHKNSLTLENIMGFHSGKHTTDDSVNVVMQREDELKTLSITRVTSESTHLRMQYTDLLQHSVKEVFHRMKPPG